MNSKTLHKIACENSLAFFVEKYFEVLEPETTYQHNWHVDVLCLHAEAVYYGLITNLDVNIPPRTIKSLIFNVFLPCWIWTKRPSFKILSGSHSADLSTGFNIRRRELIQSEEYQHYWPIQIKDDSNKQHYFANTKNGFMASASVCGKVTGKGADILIMDDSLDAQDAHSETKREAANNWYSNSFYNRLQDKRLPKRINVMQRLHERDLSGHIAEKYKFEKLVIPMQKESDDKFIGTSLNWVDPRKEGEFIHPERYAENEKADEYKGLGSYGWAGQMQQRPAPLGGGLIKREYFSFFRSDKEFDLTKSNTIQVWDLKFSEGGSSYAVGAVWHKDSVGRIYLLDLVRGKWGFNQSKVEIRKLSLKWPEARQIHVENKANGPAILDDLKNEFPGLKKWEPGAKSKIERIMAVEPDLETEGIELPENAVWVEDYLGEMILFPNGQNDDQVDVTSMGLLILKTKRRSAFSA